MPLSLRTFLRYWTVSPKKVRGRNYSRKWIYSRLWVKMGCQESNQVYPFLSSKKTRAYFYSRFIYTQLFQVWHTTAGPCCLGRPGTRIRFWWLTVDDTFSPSEFYFKRIQVVKKVCDPRIDDDRQVAVREIDVLHHTWSSSCLYWKGNDWRCVGLFENGGPADGEEKCWNRLLIYCMRYAARGVNFCVLLTRCRPANFAYFSQY